MISANPFAPTEHPSGKNALTVNRTLLHLDRHPRVSMHKTHIRQKRCGSISTTAYVINSLKRMTHPFGDGPLRLNASSPMYTCGYVMVMAGDPNHAALLPRLCPPPPALQDVEQPDRPKAAEGHGGHQERNTTSCWYYEPTGPGRSPSLRLSVCLESSPLH